MLTEKYYGNFFMSQTITEGGDIPAIDTGETDSFVFFEEQQVTTTISDKTWPTGVINCSQSIPPETLIINFEGQEYTLQRRLRESSGTYLYGCPVKAAGGVPMFSDELPFLVTYDGTAWALSTAHEGTYTISARLPDPDPEPTPEPKRKGRSSIISQLTRLVKALGGNARKSSRTIASQLSALADIAEAGGIGGGGLLVTLIQEDPEDPKTGFVSDVSPEDIAEAYFKRTSVTIVAQSLIAGELVKGTGNVTAVLVNDRNITIFSGLADFEEGQWFVKL